MIDDEYLAITPRSRQLAERARDVLPDGVSTDTRLFDPYGVYIHHAFGTRKRDVDGNEYRDFFGGHGALMLGHSHPRVTQAIQEAAQRGVQFAANHRQEVEWAELICRHIPTARCVRFTGSGTEATLLAIRMARTYTGRSKLVRVRTHYHGWHDFAVSGYSDHFDGRPAPGVLSEIADNTLLVTPNDLAELHRTIDSHRSDIAAVLLEPLGSHFGIVPTDDDYLKAAAQLAREADIPVILDEVISAFRVAPEGVQGVLGLQPDLTCMGKVAAGGLPGGIVCGNDRLMSVLWRKPPSDSGRLHRKVFHQGTFTGNPITASAALVTIDEIVRNGLCEHANRLAHSARIELNALFARTKVRWRAYGRYSAFHIMPDVPPDLPEESFRAIEWRQFMSRPVPLLQTLRKALLLEGVDIGSRGTGFISGVHGADDVDCLLAAFEAAIHRLRAEHFIE